MRIYPAPKKIRVRSVLDNLGSASATAVDLSRDYAVKWLKKQRGLGEKMYKQR